MGQRFSIRHSYYLILEEPTVSTLTRVRDAVMDPDRDDPLPYECRTCGARFELQRQVCPECGGYTLDRLDWSSDC
jgi:rRNA maturation endonuclease Nob1